MTGRAKQFSSYARVHPTVVSKGRKTGSTLKKKKLHSHSKFREGEEVRWKL